MRYAFETLRDRVCPIDYPKGRHGITHGISHGLSHNAWDIPWEDYGKARTENPIRCPMVYAVRYPIRSVPWGSPTGQCILYQGVYHGVTL